MMSVLHECAASGDNERLEDLLDQQKFNKEERDEDWGGRTPLMCGVISGNAGANPTMRNDEGKTAAHFAAESGRNDILRILIENGGDETAIDNYEDTPMTLARLYGHMECADVISAALRDKITLRKRPCDWLLATTNSDTKKIPSWDEEQRRRRKSGDDDHTRKRRRSGGRFLPSSDI